MSATPPLMKCGHAANATDEQGHPCCAICWGIVEGADEIAETPPDLEGREAECLYCHRRVPSSLNLAFFEYRPEKATDAYYCGCMGWN